MELNERLIAAREHAKFETARDAAEALGIPYPTYAGHENGSSGFRADKGELYARRFKVSFEWLMRGRGPMIGAGTSPEETLKSALLAYGVDQGQLNRVMNIIRTFAPATEALPERIQSDDQSQPASHPHATAPSR